MNEGYLDIHEYRDLIAGLNNPIRLSVVSALSTHRYMSHRELLDEIGQSLGIWRHLQEMISCGLVEKIILSGRDIVYSLNTAKLFSFSSFLDELCDVTIKTRNGEIDN